MRRLSPAEDHFLLLACDGLWDVLTDAEACRVVPRSCYLLTSSLEYYLTYHLTILLSDLLTYFMHSDSKACRIVVEGLHRLGSPQEVQPRPRMPHVAPCTPRLARTLHAPLHHPARTLHALYNQACDRLVETVLRSAKCTDNVSVVLVMLDWLPDGE